MHGSKVGVAKWLAATRMDDLHPPSLAKALDVSVPAARRIATAIEATGEPPGESRMMALLQSPPGHASETGNKTTAKLGTAFSPIACLTRAQRSVMAVLRSRVRGVTVQQVATAACLSVGHTRRCLKALEEQGYARRDLTRVPWGYGSLKLNLWSLELAPECIAALAFLPRTHSRPDHSCPERVPPEFWRLFWSGASAKELNLPEHADFVAGSLLDSADRVARAWALRCLPVESLRKCREMRGYNSGEIARKIDTALARRADA